jgi:hypothetical protein
MIPRPRLGYSNLRARESRHRAWQSSLHRCHFGGQARIRDAILQIPAGALTFNPTLDEQRLD